MLCLLLTIYFLIKNVPSKSNRQRHFKMKNLFVTDLVSEYFYSASLYLHAGNFDVPCKLLLFQDKQRKFLETVDLQIGLKNYDPQKDKRFSGTVKYVECTYLGPSQGSSPILWGGGPPPRVLNIGQATRPTIFPCTIAAWHVSLINYVAVPGPPLGHMVYILVIVFFRVSDPDPYPDPDPHGSALIWAVGSGSGSAHKLRILIRIQEGKNDHKK